MYSSVYPGTVNYGSRPLTYSQAPSYAPNYVQAPLTTSVSSVPYYAPRYVQAPQVNYVNRVVPAPVYVQKAENLVPAAVKPQTPERPNST